MAFRILALLAVMIVIFQSPILAATTAGTSKCLANGVALSAVVGKLSYLTSPNYPSNYQNNAKCLWMISSANNSVIKVTVLDAKLQMNTDYVEMFDGMSTSSRSIARLHGMPASTVFYTSGPHMRIRFVSNGSVTNSGFRLTYEAVNK